MSTINPISGPPTRRDYLDLDTALLRLKECEQNLHWAWTNISMAHHLLGHIEHSEKLREGIDMQLEECEALRKWVQAEIAAWDEREKRNGC